MKWKNPTPTLPKGEGVSFGIPSPSGRAGWGFLQKNPINNEISVFLESGVLNLYFVYI
jgi:hypothetical protein